MSITLYPSKLLMGEMEARIPGGLTLLPGQLLRFEGENPAYGRITGVRAVRKKTEASKSKVAGCIVRLQLLHGQPDLSPQTVTILNDVQMASEVQHLHEPAAQPMALSADFTADATQLGPLTVIEGDDFVLKYETLMAFIAAIQPYQKVLIFDPLGLFEESASVHYCQAGRDMRLSIQTVGHQRFLDAFGELFPGGLRNWALQAVAASWPITQDFIGLERLLDWRSISESPLKALILQNQQAVLKAGIFAERPNQVMQWTSLIWQSCNVLDLSALPVPWKSLFYEESVRLLLQEADSSILPVLIYPEHYLDQWPDWLKEAEESGLSLLVLASSQKETPLENRVSTRVTAKSRQAIGLEGRLTGGLPVTFSLSDSTVAPKVKAEKPLKENSSIVDLASPQREAAPQFDAPTHEHQQILDQLFANQISIAQSVGQKPAAPIETPPIEQPQVAPAAAAPSLDYPDADEGAWMEAATAYTPPKQSMPQPDVAFPETDQWGSSDFDFDLNLDQKSLESSQLESLRLETSVLSGFRSESGPGGIPVSPSSSTGGSSHWSEGPGTVDLSQSAEALLGDEVPVYHRAVESTNPNISQYQPGERVNHEKYGPGVITKIVPMNDSVVLNITFESVGKRLLDPRLAPLTRV